MAVSIFGVDFLVAIAALSLAVIYIRNKKRKSHEFPPGPRGLPIIGNLLQMCRDPIGAIMTWADKYGPIYRIKLGTQDAIVLNDAKIIKESFQETSFNGRTPNPVILAFSRGNYGIAMAEGDRWDEQRRFTLRKLRDFGFAKSTMEGTIMEEVNSMIRWFDKHLGKPIVGNKIFNGAVVNSLWSIMSGEREEWDAPEQPEILKCTEQIVSSIDRISSSGLTIAPILRYIAPKYSGWNDWIKHIDDLMNITTKSIERHKKELDSNNPQDFIDHYLVENQNTKDPSSSFYGETGDKNLKAVISDLFFAGSETTSHTLSWAMLFLAMNQPIQKKLHEELDAVVGSSRQPSLNDRTNLPYFEAVIMEVLRMSSLTQTGLPHRMLDDSILHGYLFPKNCIIISNMYKVHHDPKVWGDPEVFRPERFLSSDGKTVIKHEALIPFSVGKRQCLGEFLARDSLFLFLGGMFHKFLVEMDPNDSGEAIKIKPTMNVLNIPAKFQIVVRIRNNGIE